MSYLYRTTNGNLATINGLRMRAVSRKEEDRELDACVDLEVLLRESIPENSAILENAVEAMRFIQLTASGSCIMMAGPALESGSIFKGISIDAGAASDVISYIDEGVTAVMCGNSDIAAGKRVVSAPFGKAAEFQATEIALASASGLATGDFNNSYWDADGEKAYVKTTVDVEADFGKVIEIYAIGANGAYVSETISLGKPASYLSEQEGTGTPIGGQLLIKKIVGFRVPVALAGTLVIQNNAGEVCKQIATPSGSYGTLAVAGDAKGQRIKITAGSAITGTLVIMSGGAAEVVEFNAESTKYSANGYNVVDLILIGDDGVATQSYTIVVEANTDEQIIAYTIDTLTANTPGVVEIRSTPAIGVDSTGKSIIFPVLGIMAKGNSSIYGIGTLGINTVTGKHFITNASGVWELITSS